MSGSKQYLLDANVFIEAKNRCYGFNLCPGYWSALVLHSRNRRVQSIDRVRDELIRPSMPGEEPDPLSDWARNKVPDTFFKQTHDHAVLEAFQELVNWVNSEPQFMESARADFASAADGWLIAFAKVNGMSVVTHEEYAPRAQKKVPMPNLCLEFNVDYVDTFEMLKDLKVRFILSTKRRQT
jgi:hypothetical protein